MLKYIPISLIFSVTYLGSKEGSGPLHFFLLLNYLRPPTSMTYRPKPLEETSEVNLLYPWWFRLTSQWGSNPLNVSLVTHLLGVKLYPLGRNSSSILLNRSVFPDRIRRFEGNKGYNPLVKQLSISKTVHRGTPGCRLCPYLRDPELS